MDALQSMEKYLSTRPTRFPSLASGIEWQYVRSLTFSRFTILKHVYSTRSRTIRNHSSARASVPSLLYEEGQPTDPSRPWVWRTNLSATKPFWENWFIGLSGKFLAARGGKLLLLAGTDRLDKELMIGQMQGMCSYELYLGSVGILEISPKANRVLQASISYRSFLKPATSSKRISQPKQRKSWSISTDAMIGVRWCFPQRWQICKRRRQ